MDIERFTAVSAFEWRIEPVGAMRVPAVIYADAALIRDMDDKVYDQVTNVAALPGIVDASYAMPDAHWGYGFPIGGVAAFDPDLGGVISAGGVGFDISCGVRTLLTGLTLADVEPRKQALADALFRHVPAGVGSTGKIVLSAPQMDAMLAGGARWAIDEGYGTEAQHVSHVFDRETAAGFGLAEGAVVVGIHCGSRGLGHQIGTEFLREMVDAAGDYGIVLPDRELACAPIRSPLGERYLGAMRAAINCAIANRQIVAHLAREVFAELFPGAALTLLFDVSHNTCKIERHTVDGVSRALHVHRKGATRAFGPGHPDLPEDLRALGQPVMIGGSMGTASHVLAGTEGNEIRAFSSACHGAGRAMSRHQARKLWRGRELVDGLAERGIVIRSPSFRGVAEEAPGAYKDVDAVVEAAERCGLARRVARLEPLVCVKG
jgi:tRNA-splicing ligase RtcB